MRLRFRLFQVILIGTAILCSLSGCAELVPSLNIEPPRKAFTFLKKEIIYKICINANRKEERNQLKLSSEEHCYELKSGALASGALVSHYNSPETDEEVSLILTAGHFCKDPQASIPSSFGPSMIPQITSAEVFWRYTAYDYKGNPHAVNKVLAKTGVTDMCLMESKRIDQDPLVISDSTPKYGDKILNIGTPYGLFLPPLITLDEGLYLGGGDDSVPIIMSDLVIGPGSSGSMVVQRQGLTWKLVGMIHSVIYIYDPPVGKRKEIAEPLLSLGASLKQIKEFIKKVEDGYINQKDETESK